jgi:hypothetical protein
VKRFAIAACLPLLASAACLSSPASSGPLSGVWAGEHIALTTGRSGGSLEYDCAAGRIDGPIIPRQDGTFERTGTHTPGTGGPERIGEPKPSYPASYLGKVVGTTMTLVVQYEIAGGSPRLGPFVLVRGAEPRLLRCL